MARNRSWMLKVKCLLLIRFRLSNRKAQLYIRKEFVYVLNYVCGVRVEKSGLFFRGVVVKHVVYFVEFSYKSTYLCDP